MRKTIYFALMAIFLFTRPGYALYTDEIAISIDEVWPAAKEGLKYAGLKKINEEKKTFETKWTYDTVTQSVGPLKNFTKDELERRYRYKVSITERYGDTLVTVKAVFQKKRKGLIQYSWRLVKPSADDLDVERDAFMKILTQIEKTRNSAAPVI